MANLAVANVPGHVDTQPLAELDRSICEVTLPQVVANLTGVQPEVVAEEDPGPRTVVFSGSFEAGWPLPMGLPGSVSPAPAA